MHCKDTILRTQNNWPYSKLIPNSGIPIPFELTRGKKNITLKIAARLKNMTGDIFDIRILPSNSEMDLK